MIYLVKITIILKKLSVNESVATPITYTTTSVIAIYANKPGVSHVMEFFMLHNNCPEKVIYTVTYCLRANVLHMSIYCKFVYF